ncbi:MAG: hypothetical protein J2O48_05805 [Solirubrobacterales bacterium]|nr:hypothetical protein [Solirubrobacterales bacterium]
MSFSGELDKEREQILHLIRHASSSWAAAMRSHKLAPPDAGFAARLQELSAAASIEQQAWERAHGVGLAWRPVPGAENSAPPYELRPGTGRRGPEELWRRFDAAVSALNTAIAGSSAKMVSEAFGTVAEVTADLAHAVRAEDETALAAQDFVRVRAQA